MREMIGEIISNLLYSRKENESSTAILSRGAGACSPEDVGGMHGYHEMLKAFKRPESNEAKDYREWLGLSKWEVWDADFCSVREVNKRLCLLV